MTLDRSNAVPVPNFQSLLPENKKLSTNLILQRQSIRHLIPSSFFTMDVLAVDSSDNTVMVPSEFICPITLEMMKNPVMTRYGHCFDRSALLTWMRSSDEAHCDCVCPLTRKPLRISDIVNHHSLGFRIKAWCDENSYCCKRSEPSSTGGSSCDTADDEDFVTHYFVSTDLSQNKEQKRQRGTRDRNALPRSQSSREPITASSASIAPRMKRNLLKMAVSWTQRT